MFNQPPPPFAGCSRLYHLQVEQELLVHRYKDSTGITCGVHEHYVWTCCVHVDIEPRLVVTMSTRLYVYVYSKQRNRIMHVHVCKTVMFCNRCYLQHIASCGRHSHGVKVPFEDVLGIKIFFQASWGNNAVHMELTSTVGKADTHMGLKLPFKHTVGLYHTLTHRVKFPYGSTVGWLHHTITWEAKGSFETAFHMDMCSSSPCLIWSSTRSQRCDPTI